MCGRGGGRRGEQAGCRGGYTACLQRGLASKHQGKQGTLPLSFRPLFPGSPSLTFLSPTCFSASRDEGRQQLVKFKSQCAQRKKKTKQKHQENNGLVSSVKPLSSREGNFPLPSHRLLSSASSHQQTPRLGLAPGRGHPIP